ncbi:MAG: TonB-dependent receptor domain-containing protein [Saprospiraceae bacterium]
MRLSCLATLGLFMILSGKALAQSNFEKAISAKFEGQTIFEILTELEKQYAVSICTEPEKLPWYKLDYSFRERTLHESLRGILPKHGLAYVPFGDTLVVVCRSIDLNADYLRGLKTRCLAGQIKLPEFLRPLELETTLGQPPAASNSLKINGLLFDSDTKEGIAGAVILQNGKPAGPPTNGLGQFEIKLPAGPTELSVQYLGYRETRLKLTAWANGSVEIPLETSPLGLQEVLIEGNKAARKSENVQTAVEALPVSTVKELPSFLGEADVIKSLNTLPGVSSAGDGASGFNVRGGNIDQNLTMQDDAPLFNTSHVLGFFSVYNPDLVRSVTLYKGHVPARYGGRLSSVLDVQLRDGDFSKFHGNVGVGLATAKGMLEGPLVRKKVSFMAGFRRSYSDWMLKAAPIAEGKKSSAWFFDGLAKVSGRLGERVNFALTGYQTSDYFRYGQVFGYSWSNRLLNLSVRHPLGQKIVSVWQGNIGRYSGGYFSPQGLGGFDLENGLDYRNLGWRANWVPGSRHEATFGVQWNQIRARPESLRPAGEQSAVQPQTVAKDNGEEYAVFAEDEWRLAPRWKMSGGLRGVYFRHFGEKTVWRYRDGLPQTAENRLDSTYFGAGETVKSYAGLEPRLSVSWNFAERKSLKFSYNRMRQYIHLISNLASPTPVDVWQVSNTHIRPQTGDQWDVGYTTEWADRMWELAADIFYKQTDGVPVFKNLPNLLLNGHLETELLPGKGTAYGSEVAIKKRTGVLTGWLTYTYARSWVKVETPFAAEAINKGQRFASDYDQPHQINLYFKNSFTPSASIAFNYVMRTGRPVSAPQRVYTVGGVVAPDFALRNNARIPNYHRVDVSLNFDENKSRLSGAKTTFSLSIYNVFARKNPFSVFFEKKPDSYPKAYSLALVGSAIPAANLTITF